MQNKFLNEFIKRQATIIESVQPPEKDKKGRKKSHYGTADGKAPFGGDDMASRFNTIVKERPSKKAVLAYFRDRIAQLVAEEEY